ncbi:hypothetical protein QBC34DRAFT_409339 [Podospora aff. communis PSN243]|uniref:Extracellular matrix protein n=1 Tax=Podospora aff. communis PSN243 TaxID=3040156 RepID=A0AAV9GIY7_9PEZI|nr:hypothetical protein QBC34DRAFT_409339 [Podospora aff. communis PSN243]
MKFTAAILAGLATVGLAKPAITNTVFDVREGQPFTLTWIDAVGPVKVDLVSGPDPGSLQPVRTLATGETDGSLTFTPSGLPSGNYAFRVTDSDNDPNFSVLFAYVGTGSASSTGSVSSTRTSTRSTTSAASSTPVSSDVSSSVTSSVSTSTRTTSTRTQATTTPTSTPTNNNEGQRFSSSLALVFMTVAALVFFN